MVLFSDIIGHDAICRYLKRVADRDELSHAYVFSGPAHLGKTAVATCLLSTLRDVYVVERPIDEKTGERKAAIPVEAIRDVRSHLSRTSFDGGVKAVLVHDAGTMTTAAQNALLKTLEEPRGKTLIILLATDVSALLPTIRSRAVHLAFTPLARAVLKKGLVERGVDPSRAEKLARIARGRVGTALSLLDLDMQHEDEAHRQEAMTFFSGTFAAQQRAIDTLLKEKDEELLRATICAWRTCAHDCLLIQTGNEEHASEPEMVKNFAATQSAPSWARTLRALSEAEESISKNIHANLALEAFALPISL